LEKAKLAIIGGSGFERPFRDTKQLRVETPYGSASLSILRFGDRDVVFLPRHGPQHSIPPHKINYKANMRALREIGVERIIAVNAVGAVNRDFMPSDIVVPHDFIDFTRRGPVTFFDEGPVTHVDMSQPYCPEIRMLLLEVLKKLDIRVWKRAVYLCTDGPRFETPAEIEMFRRFGSDVIGMTGVPEAVLARELQMCYASLCYVSNMAAGLREKIAQTEASRMSKVISPWLEQALIEAVKALPLAREACQCPSALEGARF
jgi:5'-methylthioadenosine phosphorylase